MTLRRESTGGRWEDYAADQLEGYDSEPQDKTAGGRMPEGQNDQNEELRRRAQLEAEAERLKKRAAQIQELAKYQAAAFDRLSTALVAIGLLALAANMILQPNQFQLSSGVLIFVVGCPLGALVLHFIGRAVLTEGYGP